jgi:hypothetical protein
MAEPQRTPERLIEEAEARGIGGGRTVSLLAAVWAISVAAAGGLEGADPDGWHDCQICGLNHRRMP